MAAAAAPPAAVTVAPKKSSVDKLDETIGPWRFLPLQLGGENFVLNDAAGHPVYQRSDINKIEIAERIAAADEIPGNKTVGGYSIPVYQMYHMQDNPQPNQVIDVRPELVIISSVLMCWIGPTKYASIETLRKGCKRLLAEVWLYTLYHFHT